MTFEGDWIDDDTDALDETCSIEQGSIHNVSTLSGLLCMPVPPEKEDRDSTLILLIYDASAQIEVGNRVLYNTQRYNISHLQRDGVYAKVFSTDWPETLS
jgi:hypothetical protein